MKTKSVNFKIFVAAFAVSVAMLCSSNLVSAQCGYYFKTNYRAVTKLGSGVFIGQEMTEGLDDWTGDGKSDFWNFRRDPNTQLLNVVIYPSRPAGYWDWDNPIVYTTTISNFGGTYEVADFDADGRKDLVFGENDYRILHNTGTGSLTSLPIFTDTDGQLVSNGNIGFADVNGDNLLDWLYVIYINNTPEIRYQLQNPNGSFGGKTTIATATPQNFLSSSNKKLGDFNGDGKIDILYSSYNSTANTPVYALIKNLGAGNFQVGAPVTGDLYAPYNQLRGRFIDFNNDGKEDVLSGARIFYGQADGTFSRFQIPSAVDGLSTSPAELNGDNNLDVVEVGATYYATIVNDGAGGFTRTVYQQNNPGQVSWKFEDFSGDGKADVYQRRLNSDQGNPKNIFGERLISIKESVCQPSGEMKLNNFEFDRDLDVATWNPNSGNWSSKNARWGFQVDPVTKVFNWGLGSHGDVPAPGDFDGDGITDYSVYRNSTGTWYIRQSTNSAWLVFKFGLGGDIAVPNDYDGGGKTDIAVFRPSDGNWYIWSSETQSFTALHFGATGDKPVPADYDGDGKTDIAVYRPSEGNWYYLKSSDNQFAVFHWGIETDKPVPADYDGDGKADLTIYRDGTWWILRSSNNSPVAVLFGAAGDIPLPVYRNLASADLTYYHRANNSWSSFDNRVFYGFTLGANGDVPVYYGLPNN